MLEICLQLTFRQQITQGESTIIPKLASPQSGGQSCFQSMWLVFISLLSLCSSKGFANTKILSLPFFWSLPFRWLKVNPGQTRLYECLCQNEHYPTNPQIPGRAWQVPPFYEWGLGGTIVRTAGGNPSRSDLKTRWSCLEDRCPLQWQRAKQELRDIHSCWAATEKAGKSEVLGNNLYPRVNLRQL